jgi:hypothetical protein
MVQYDIITGYDDALHALEDDVEALSSNSIDGGKSSSAWNLPGRLRATLAVPQWARETYLVSNVAVNDVFAVPCALMRAATREP